jgi:uncharacterized membrane protein
VDAELTWAILFDCFLMLGLAWYYKKYPPKKINELYGFRTRRTMANQDIWDVANKRSAQDLWTYALYLLVISVFLIVFNIPYAFLIHMVVLLLGLFAAIYASIRYLDKHFDKNGNRL